MAGPATLTIAESSEAIAWPMSTAVASAQGVSTRRVASLSATRDRAGAADAVVMAVTPLRLSVSSVYYIATDESRQSVSGECDGRGAGTAPPTFPVAPVTRNPGGCLWCLRLACPLACSC